MVQLNATKAPCDGYYYSGVLNRYSKVGGCSLDLIFIVDSDSEVPETSGARPERFLKQNVKLPTLFCGGVLRYAPLRYPILRYYVVYHGATPTSRVAYYILYTLYHGATPTPRVASMEARWRTNVATPLSMQAAERAAERTKRACVAV